MVEFVSPVHKQIEDVFILDVEALCDFDDKFLKSLPDSLGDTQILAVFHSVLEKSANSGIIGEAFGRGQNIILHGGYSRAGYLG